MELEAKLVPLGGKYYGSEIELYQNGSLLTTLDIWVMGDYTPSERELEKWDSLEDFREWCSDSHFESALGYRICQRIVEAINGA